MAHTYIKTLATSKSADNSARLEEKIMETTAALQIVDDLNKSSNQVNHFYDIKSLIFEDVPENENTLETLLTNNSKPETHDLNKNNSEKTEPVLNTQNLTAETHKIYSSCRMYTRESNVSNHMSVKLSKIGKELNSEVNGCQVSFDHSENESNASSTRVPHDSDKNNSVKTEPVSKIRNLTAESHKIYLSRRMCTRQSNVSNHMSELSKIGKELNSEVNGCQASSDHSENELDASRTRVPREVNGYQVSSDHSENKMNASRTRVPRIFNVRFKNMSENCSPKTKDDSVKIAVAKIIRTINDKTDDPAPVASSSCNGNTLYDGNSFDSNANNLCNNKETGHSSNMNLVQCSSSNFRIKRSIESKPVAFCKKLHLMHACVTLIDCFANTEAFIKEGLKNKTDISYVNKIFSSAVDGSDGTSDQNGDSCNKINYVNECLSESKMPVKKYNRKKGKVKDIDNLEKTLGVIQSGDLQLADEINNKISSIVVDKSSETGNQNVDDLNKMNDVKKLPESYRPVNRRNRKKEKFKGIHNLMEKFSLSNSNEPQLPKNDTTDKISSTTVNKNVESTNQNIDNLNKMNIFKTSTESKQPVKKCDRKKGKYIDNLEERLDLINSDEPQLPMNYTNNKINLTAVNKTDETSNQHVNNLNKMNYVKKSTENNRPVKMRRSGKDKGIDNLEEECSLINSDDSQLPKNDIDNKISSAAMNKSGIIINQNVDNLNEMNIKHFPESKTLVKKCNRKKGKEDIVNLKEKLNLINNDEPQLPNNETNNKMSISRLEDNQFNHGQNVTHNISNQHPKILNTNFEDVKLSRTSHTSSPKNINRMQNGVIKNKNISKNSLAHSASSFEEMGAAVRCSQEKRCESNLINDECNKPVDKSKYALFNGTCDKKPNSVTYTKSSSRAHLSLMEMFKRYTDETDTFSNPNGLPTAQGNLIQNMLANSYLPKNLKKSNKLLSFSDMNNTRRTDKSLPPNNIADSIETDMPLYSNNIEGSVKTDTLLSLNNEKSKDKNKSLSPHICRDSKEIETVCPELLVPSISDTYDHINSKCLNITSSMKCVKRSILTEITTASSTPVITSTPNNRSSFMHRSLRSASVDPIFHNSNSYVADTNNVDNKYKGDIETKSSSKSNTADVTDTRVFCVQSSGYDNSPQTFSKNKASVEPVATKCRSKKDSSELSLNYLHNLNNNSIPLIKADNKNSKNVNKKPRKTVGKLLSSRMQTRNTAKSDAETKSEKMEFLRKSNILKKKSCSVLKNTQKLSHQKRKRSHSVHSFDDSLCTDTEVASKTVRGALNEKNNIPSTVNDFDSTIQIKRKKQSASVEPKLFNSRHSTDNSNQAVKVSLKRDHSPKRRNIRSKSVEPMHALNMPVPSQDKVSSKVVKTSFGNGNDISPIMNNFDSTVKAKRRKRSASEEPQLYSSCHSVKNMSNQVAKGSLKGRNSLKTLDKTSISVEPKLNLNVHVACAKNKVSIPQNQQNFKNKHLKHSPTLSEPFNIVNEPHDEEESFSTDSDSLDTEVPSENLSTEAQFNEQNGYSSISFPVQTLNTHILNPANNSFIYGNSIVQYPQLLNQRVYPNLNQFVTQSQNPYYSVQNTYGNFNVPSFNIVSPQPALTYPIYQNRPIQQSSNFPYNAPSNANFGSQPSSLVLNAPNATNIGDRCSNSNHLDFPDQRVYPNLNPCVTQSQNGRHSNSNHLNFPDDQRVYPNLNQCVTQSQNNTLSRKETEKDKAHKYLIAGNTNSCIVDTTSLHCRLQSQNFDRKLEEQVEKDVRQGCFDKMRRKQRNILRHVSWADLTVIKFCSNSFVLNALKHKICEMVPDFDIPPKVEYVFEDTFFTYPMRVVMKDYVDFHLQSLYTKPCFKEHFVRAAYRKFPFRDCTYLCQAFPPKNKNIDFTDLICYLSCASILAILDECKKRNIVQ